MILLKWHWRILLVLFATLRACLQIFEAKHKCLSVRQSLLIISARRWHSHTAEGHMGLRAGYVRSLLAEKLHLAAGAGAPCCRERDGGTDMAWATQGPAALMCEWGWATGREAVIPWQCCIHGKGGWCYAEFTSGLWSTGQVGWTSSSLHPCWNTLLCCYPRVPSRTLSIFKYYCLRFGCVDCYYWWGLLDAHKHRGKKS